MKKLLLSLCTFAVVCLQGHTATAQLSPLDPTFGTNGISLLDSVDAFYGVDMSLQDDGKILITVNGNCNHGFLCRLLTNGALDPGFTPSPSYRTYPVYHPGVVEMQGAACNPNMTVVRQLSSKKVLWVLGPGAIFQYNADGTTDSAFGINGGASVGSADPKSIQNTCDVKEMTGTGVLFAGSTFPPPIADSLSLARMKYNGSLDASFGSNGYVRVALPVSKVGPQSTIRSIKILPDNRVLVAGNCFTPGSATSIDIFIALYKVDGTLDATFGNGGVKVIDYNHAWDDVYSIAYRDNNNIYILGSSDTKRIVFKTNITGTIDNTFGTGGLATFPYSSGNGNMWYYGAVTPDNYLYTSVDTGAAQLYNYLSYNSNGTANTQFTGNGIYLSGTYDKISCMIAQPDNKMLLLGTNGLHPRLLRFKANKGTGVGSVAQSNDISLWAADGRCFIQFAHDEQAFTAALLSIDGKVLNRWSAPDFTAAGEHKYSMTLPSGLPQGMYLLRVDSREGTKVLKLAL